MTKYISVNQAVDKLKSMFPSYDEEFLRSMITTYSRYGDTIYRPRLELNNRSNNGT